MNSHEYCEKCGSEMIDVEVEGYNILTGKRNTKPRCQKDPCHIWHDYVPWHKLSKKKQDEIKPKNRWKYLWWSVPDFACEKCKKRMFTDD